MKKFLAVVISMFIAISSFAGDIEFVVKAAAGGPDDTISRKLKDHFEKTTPNTFKIVNKAGGGHKLGYLYFGETKEPSVIVVDSNFPDTEAYKTSEELTTLGTFTNILYVSSSLNINSINELVELSKKRPINFGHGGLTTYSEKGATKLCTTILRCNMIPYKGGALAMTDMMGGHIDAYALISYGSNQFAENSKLKPLFMYSTRHHPNYMNIPLLPDNMKNLEIRNDIKLYGRNLTKEQSKQLRDSLSKLDDSVLVNIGLWK